MIFDKHSCVTITTIKIQNISIIPESSLVSLYSQPIALLLDLTTSYVLRPIVLSFRVSQKWNQIVCFVVNIYFHLFWLNTRSETAGLYGIMLIVPGIPKLFSSVVVPFYIPIISTV